MRRWGPHHKSAPGQSAALGPPVHRGPWACADPLPGGGVAAKAAECTPDALRAGCGGHLACPGCLLHRAQRAPEVSRMPSAWGAEGTRGTPDAQCFGSGGHRRDPGCRLQPARRASGVPHVGEGGRRAATRRTAPRCGSASRYAGAAPLAWATPACAVPGDAASRRPLGRAFAGGWMRRKHFNDPGMWPCVIARPPAWPPRPPPPRAP